MTALLVSHSDPLIKEIYKASALLMLTASDIYHYVKCEINKLIVGKLLI